MIDISIGMFIAVLGILKSENLRNVIFYCKQLLHVVLLHLWVINVLQKKVLSLLTSENCINII